MKRTLTISIVSLLLLMAATLPLLAAPTHEDVDAIQAAVQARLETLPDADLRWQVLEATQAGDWAYATAGASSRASGQPAPTEPLVVMVRREPGGGWQVALPGEPAFDAWLALAPESLIDAGTKAYLSGPARGPSAPQAEVSGYRAPWLAGYKGTVVRRDGTNHAKQVDFNLWTTAGSRLTASSGSAWEAGTVAAAKAGTVVFAKDSSNSGCPSLDCWRQANMVVIRHAANEYSWYVHLAHQSVPAGIVPGATIPSGTAIGVEGETGFATGVHLHYMVSSDLPQLPDPNDPNAAAWPQKLLTFDFAEAAWEELQSGLVIVSQNRLGEAECPQTGGAILYKHAGYDCGGQGEGQGYVLRAATGWQNVPAAFNDQASSLRLPEGGSVRLYEHVDRAGAAVCRSAGDETFEHDLFDGGQKPLNDQVSSFELFEKPGCDSGPEAGPQNWRARFGTGDDCWHDPGCRPDLCPQIVKGPTLAASWSGGAPCADLEGSDWVAEFRTALDFEKGEYVFSLDHEAGAQLWLDGLQVARHDSPGSRQICNEEGGYILEGRHSLRVLLRNGSEDTRARLEWHQDTSACQPVAASLDLVTGLGQGSTVEIVLTRAGDLACACRRLAETGPQGEVTGLDLTGCVEAGDRYDVYVKPRTALRQVLRDTVFQAGGNALSLSGFVAGDTAWSDQHTGDNQVNLMDYLHVLQAQGAQDPGLDVNGDGGVDALDLDAVSQHWGSSGAGWTDVSPCQEIAMPSGGQARSSAPASISLAPASGTFPAGGRVDLEVRLDTGGQAVAGVDLLIGYDPGVLSVADADQGLAGIQIQPGPAFDRTHHNQVRVAAGEIRFSADTGEGQPFNGEGLVATLPFTAAAGIENTTISVHRGELWTAESNVAGAGDVRDILGQTGAATLHLTGPPARPLPRLSLTPAGGAVLDARGIKVTALATDPYTQVREVYFEAQYGGDWALLGTDTEEADGWGLFWDTSAAPDGPAALRATAVLPGGMGTAVTETQILLDRRPPRILTAVASPSPAPRPGAMVTIEVSATDMGADSDGGSGVGGIDVYATAPAGDGWVLLGSLPGDAGGLAWDTADWPPGMHQIAFDVWDQAGNRGPVPDQRLTLEIEVDRPYSLYLPLARKP